ncbi:phenylalanine 4-monooxygenase [Oxalobacteraceae bacterium CAVE-383]|nr:phenylalanine 4-monooxygenase [Oxalobacteraceae bacterium CAVE-383]
MEQRYLDHIMKQPCHAYTAADHAVWRTLFATQAGILQGRACKEFIAGLHGLDMAADGIPRFDALNELLHAATGWRIVAVPGLVPDDVFFGLLANRHFPASWWIRKPAQMDYLQEPDVFHDIYGHVPLLMNPIFADYMQAYGEGGLRSNCLNSLGRLARLYWYTVEFGLINTAEGLRIYGSGILSSKGESIYSLESAAPNRVQFDLQRVMSTRYRIDSFQKTYFVIDSFKALFEATEADLAPIYRALEKTADIGAEALLANDRVLQRGTGDGWQSTRDTG